MLFVWKLLIEEDLVVKYYPTFSNAEATQMGHDMARYYRVDDGQFKSIVEVYETEQEIGDEELAMYAYGQIRMHGVKPSTVWEFTEEEV